MSRENVEIVRLGYELFAAGDLEGVSALFASDAELADSGGLGLADTAAGTWRGPAGFLRSTNEALEVEDFMDAGEAVVVPVRISGRGRASGAKLEMHLAHLWVFRRDGKVIRGEVYRTAEEALQAVGVAE
jgi:ketosteroid isomerase-like protein